MRRFAFILAIVVAVTTATMVSPAVAQTQPQQVTGLDASLSGSVVVPGPNAGDPDGSGTAHVVLIPSDSRICYSLSASDIAPATAAHIHREAAGIDGPIVLELLPPPPTQRTSSECIEVDPALLDGLLANPDGYYVDVHNSEFPNGAIRDQLAESTESGSIIGG
jgi:CHRD domain